jgi:hypothetical protein
MCHSPRQDGENECSSDHKETLLTVMYSAQEIIFYNWVQEISQLKPWLFFLNYMSPYFFWNRVLLFNTAWHQIQDLGIPLNQYKWHSLLQGSCCYLVSFCSIQIEIMSQWGETLPVLAIPGPWVSKDYREDWQTQRAKPCELGACCSGLSPETSSSKHSG